MVKNKIAAIVAASCVLASCGNDPIQRQKSNNPNITVDLLVTIEGCNVYRFDDGRYVYVTICPSPKTVAQSQSSHLEGQGKSTVEVPDYDSAAMVRR